MGGRDGKGGDGGHQGAYERWSTEQGAVQSHSKAMHCLLLRIVKLQIMNNSRLLHKTLS